MPPGHPIWRLLRARRVERERWRRLREERLLLGPHVASAQERGYLGALIQEPWMIRVMVTRRPPAWFTDLRCLAVMHALYCLKHVMELDVHHVVAALERHDGLELVGGTAAVVALLEPGPFLEIARADLAEARSALPPIQTDPLVLLARSLLSGAET